MNDHPLIQKLIREENLSERQAEGTLGLVLAELRNYLPAEKFRLIESVIPDLEALLASAPIVKSGFLGGLAHSLGGEKGQILMKLSKGLSQLNIPAGQHKSIAHTLKAGVEQTYPELAPLMDLG